MSTAMAERVREVLEALLPRVVAFRHDMHQHPELALREQRASARLRAELAGTGFTLWEPLLGTDVIGELPGGSARRLCLRADIDAIPVEEMTSAPYRSAVPGVMHACGHDGHTAMLLGAALALDQLRALLPVTVRVVFQPGEEMVHAGESLVALGACRDVEQVYALHGWPGLPIGAVSSKPGVLFAAGGEFTLTVRGKGCHGAMPELGNNPIPIAAQCVQRLHQVYERVRLQGAVITAGTLHAGHSPNVIPEEAVIQGTLRYLEPAIGADIEEELQRIAREVAGETGAAIQAEFVPTYALPVVNSEAGYHHLRRTVVEHLPAQRWIEAARPTMAMEDFAYYLHNRDGAMGWLGLGENHPALHAPTFDFPDDALMAGMQTLCLLALGR